MITKSTKPARPPGPCPGGVAPIAARPGWRRSPGGLVMDDRGLATVWTAWAVAALAGLLALSMGLAAVTVARHRADGAADLSALAAAAYVPWGEEYACGLARWVSERMAVRLVECQVSGWVVSVRVGAAVSGLGEVIGRARAGPSGS